MKSRSQYNCFELTVIFFGLLYENDSDVKLNEGILFESIFHMF